MPKSKPVRPGPKKSSGYPASMPPKVIAEIEAGIDQYIADWTRDLAAHIKQYDLDHPRPAKKKRSTPK
jgi:hypothetical protein